MRSVIFILMVVFASSCVTKQACERKFPAQSKDSTVIKDSFVIKIIIKDSVAIRDSIVIHEGASGKDSVPCNENSKTVIKRGGDEFVIQVRNGKVYFSYDLKATTERYQSIIREKDKEIEQAKSNVQVKEKVITVTKEVLYIPWWVKILAWIGAIAMVVLLVRLLIFYFFRK